MPYPEAIEIPGARLERWDAERHLSVVVAMAREKDAVRFLGVPQDPQGQVATAGRCAAHWRDFGFGRWAVIPDGGVPAGWVGAFHPLWSPEFGHEVELGWALVGTARGRGLATEGARAAMAASFGMGVGRVLVCLDPANTPSRAVAARLGAYPVGRALYPAGQLWLERMSRSPWNFVTAIL